MRTPSAARVAASTFASKGACSKTRRCGCGCALATRPGTRARLSFPSARTRTRPTAWRRRWWRSCSCRSRTSAPSCARLRAKLSSSRARMMRLRTPNLPQGRTPRVQRSTCRRRRPPGSLAPRSPPPTSPPPSGQAPPSSDKRRRSGRSARTHRGTATLADRGLRWRGGPTGLWISAGGGHTAWISRARQLRRQWAPRRRRHRPHRSHTAPRGRPCPARAGSTSSSGSSRSRSRCRWGCYTVCRSRSSSRSRRQRQCIRAPAPRGPSQRLPWVSQPWPRRQDQRREAPSGRRPRHLWSNRCNRCTSSSSSRPRRACRGRARSGQRARCRSSGRAPKQRTLISSSISGAQTSMGMAAVTAVPAPW
mmetsp:Transcript_29870/g.74757  ORF Transcript_29870/g.74757 Transcript_29870/m.74757 type:complete len:364 (+) Transcript_29870:2379-3470(+)